MKSALRPVLLASALVLASASASAAPSDLRERVEAYLATAYGADRPGVAVIITDDGETVYAGGRGLADVDAARPISSRTVFRIGSITKQFTAAVILQLVEEGRLSLEDPVSRFLPDYPAPGSRATVAQLLNHTGGMQPYTGIPGWMVEANTNRPYTSEELIAVFRDMPAPAQPGERHFYNNSGYVLLGAIIEKVTGNPWHQEVEQRIGRRLGLETLRYGVEEAQMPNMALGYTERESGIGLANRIHMSVPHAAGALIASVEDLARWAQALHHGQVINTHSYERMTAPTRLPDGSSVPYGFGLVNSEVRGRRGLEHGGGIFGFSTEGLYLPDEDIFVAVFANSDDPQTSPSLVARRLAALTLDDPYPSFQAQSVDPASLEPLFGVYRLSGDQGERHFYARDGRLFTQRTGGQELEVFAAGDNRFFYGPASLTWFEMGRDSTGTPVMAMHQNGDGEAERSTRVGTVPPPAATMALSRDLLQTYVGRYTAPMAPVTIAFGEGDRLTVQLGGQSPRPLRPTAENVFSVEGVDARLVFHREGEAVSRLVIHQGSNEIAAPRDGEPPAG